MLDVKLKLKKVPIIGIMGPGTNASEEEIELAEKLGGLLALEGYHILTGGSNTGIMNATLKGAKHAKPDCVTIGILPHRGEVEKTSQYADIRIPTGMGEGRNNLNVLTSDIIICCCDHLGSSPGTMSELIFTIKHRKPLICLYNMSHNFLRRNMYLNFLDQFEKEFRHERQKVVDAPEKVTDFVREWLG